MQVISYKSHSGAKTLIESTRHSMIERRYVSLKNSAKPSTVLALIALVVAFTLPFLLVRSFPNHSKPVTRITTAKILLPESPFNRAFIDQLEETAPALPKYTELCDWYETMTSNSGLDKSDLLFWNKPPERMPDILLAAAPSVAVNLSATTHTEKKIEETACAPIFGPRWLNVTTQKGDTLITLFKRLGLNTQLVHGFMRTLPQANALTHLAPETTLRFLIRNHQLEKMVVPLTATQMLLIYRDKQLYKSQVTVCKTTNYRRRVTATVQGSLYNTARQHHIPYPVIQQMGQIFKSEINFSKDVRSGDQLALVYSEMYLGDRLIKRGPLLAAQYRTKNKLYQAFRYTNARGQSDYYNPQGINLKKAFDRYPVRFSHISSTFSLNRYHPILHYRRSHQGVDLAAPLGTIIRATGDGRIIIIGRQNAYGNMIKIRHDETYATIYGHLLKFQKGLAKGDYVKRGQIIGYVGQSGLATGPHCHYEFRVHNTPRNPSTIALPQGFSIATKEMSSFKVHLARLLAELKPFEKTQLALK